MFVVDVESDGPAPGVYSMVCFGVVDYYTKKSFYGQTAPISLNYIPEALAISGFTRLEHELFAEPLDVMKGLADWLKSFGYSRNQFISDNPAFDFQWMSYYFALHAMPNPLATLVDASEIFSRGLAGTGGTKQVGRNFDAPHILIIQSMTAWAMLKH